jgi:hypothetical protein
LDRSLPPLGLFLQIKFIFLSLSQTHLFRHKERYFNGKIDQVPKTPPFSIIKNSPHKRLNFAIRVFWTNQKFQLYCFQNSQVVADPFAFGLNFSPFGIKHQNEIILGPSTPLPHQKMSIKSKKANRA